MIWLILIGIIVVIVFTWNLFKIPKVNCISMITGGVKTGKSMLSVWIAIRKYKAVHRIWFIKNFFSKLFLKKKIEEPLLYSNVKLAGIKYVLLTTEMIERKVRVNFKSVVYIQEASLLADSQYWKDMEQNERLLLFNKLYGHESHGGYLIYDTQSIQDNHYSVKRCVNTYFWIHHNTKIPFFCILKVREMFYSEDSSAINTFEEDVEESLKTIIIPKKVWKMYDAYCYSIFTDNLPKNEKTVFTPIPRGLFKRADLKTRQIVTLKKFRTIEEYKKKNEN